MALTLVTPSAPVTSMANGIIVVRCKDYPGAARGTLTVVSDALSVPGSTVRDEQTIAVQTTFTTPSTRYNAVADSVNVPIADLNLPADIGYEIYVSCRTEGDPPSNALARCMQYTYPQNGATALFGFGDDAVGMWFRPDVLARSPIDNYLIYDLGTWDTDGTGATEFIVRGWGVTGGDVALFFDLIYFVPAYNFGAGTLVTYFENPNSPMVFLANGVVSPDKDNDTTSAPWLGKFSVLDWQMPWVEQNGVIDMQEADDESTSYDTGALPADATACLAYTVGQTHIASHTVVTENFASSTTPIWVTGQGYLGEVADTPFAGFYDPPTDSLNGWDFAAAGTAPCYVPANQATANSDAVMAFGNSQLSGGSPTDPRDYFPQINMRNGIALGRVSFDTLQASYGEIGAASNNERVTARLDLDSGGNLDLSLEMLTNRNGSPTDTFTIDGPVNITGSYSTGTYYWIRVERRGYFWRARAWQDGNTEPTSWDVEGQEPLVYRATSPTTALFAAYPWDDNWNAASNDVVLYDPRSSTFFAPVLIAGVDASLPRMIITWDDFELTWDPGTGTPDDVTTRTLKYDDSVVLDPQVVVPYGSHRFVQGPVSTRSFNGGTNGFNIRAWKEPTSPNLDPAGVANVWQKESPPPLIGSIKHP